MLNKLVANLNVEFFINNALTITYCGRVEEDKYLEFHIKLEQEQLGFVIFDPKTKHFDHCLDLANTHLKDDDELLEKIFADVQSYIV